MAESKKRRPRRVSRRDRERIGARDGWTCGLCHEPVDRWLKWPDPCSASTEHVIPVWCGGSDDPANLVIAHLACNLVSAALAVDHSLCDPETADGRAGPGAHRRDSERTCKLADPRPPFPGLAEAVRRYFASPAGAWRHLTPERQAQIIDLYGVTDPEAEQVRMRARFIADVEAGRTRHRPGPAWRLGEAAAAARGVDGVPWQIREQEPQ